MKMKEVWNDYSSHFSVPKHNKINKADKRRRTRFSLKSNGNLKTVKPFHQLLQGD